MKTLASLTQLYVATFNRAPDTAGINYWLNDSNLALEQIATSFFDQVETQTLYPEGSSNADFIKSVYNNLFNREPDIDGFNYWQNELDSGSVHRSSFILAAINGAEAAAGKGASNDYNTLVNKQQLGLYFVENKQSNLDLAKQAMTSVTHDANTLELGKQIIDTFIKDLIIKPAEDLSQVAPLTTDEITNAIDLQIVSGDSSLPGLSNAAIAITEKYAPEEDIFKVSLKEDHAYFIFSASNNEPDVLALHNNTGATVAYDHYLDSVKREEYDGADLILNYTPEYTGVHYIDASWMLTQEGPSATLLIYEVSNQDNASQVFTDFFS